jgi:hypothetical protein
MLWLLLIWPNHSSSLLSRPKNAGSMFLWNDSIYPTDKCHIPEDHTLCNTKNYSVS